MIQNDSSKDLKGSKKGFERGSDDPSELPAIPSSNWLGSLRFKLAVGLVILFLILVGSNLWLIWFRGLPLLVQQNKDLHRQIGENIVTELNAQFMQAETLAKDMANLMEALPNDPDLVRSVIPNLLNLESMQGSIAGGGIWPEPYQFDEEKERASFFWGRSADNQLKLYDQYNAPEGPGYHNQEWYVPASLLDDGNVYWSRSYTDPYSLQPMVTCSVPIYRGLSLQGVATVDLKLEAVARLVSERIGDHPGYAFVIDRNNKFISFPDPAMVVTAREDQQGRIFTDFLFTNELARQAPGFRSLADRLSFLSHRSSAIVNRDAEQIKQTAKAIAERSYQIELQEARLIAHDMFRNSDTKLVVLDSFEMPDDILLNRSTNVTVFDMPHTHWKVVTVFPVEDATQAAMDIIRSISLATLIMIILWGIACAVFLWKVLFSRLLEMTERIRLSANDGREIALELDSNDELGLLTRWYNRRTRQLQQALKAAEVSAENLKRENNEHKNTAKLLERSLSMQRAILDSANLAIITLDKDGRVLNCNSGTTRLLGYREQDLVGRTFPQPLIDNAQLNEFQSYLRRRYDITISGFRLFTTALQQEDNQENEWTFICKDGSRRTVLLTITAVISEQHAIEGWLAVVADASEQMPRKHAPESPSLPVEDATLFDLNELVQEVHTETLPLSKDRNIEYGYNLPREDVYIQGNRSQIKQAITILAANAFKNTDEGNVDITLSVHHHHSQAQIQVSDTGHGVSPEDGKRIFEEPADSDEENNKLAPYIAMQLVKLHGGHIAFESTLGEGTRFTVELPLVGDLHSEAEV